ncbi:MAG: bifunctional phosphopantothenoylcysteine decarboxylase/phosphopantothenate--cysteine ligase CoaBC [Rhodospirillaceae bacterium]|nr:bifunctional phosphopantothenoylcysteine decarboxylase/phosphopantothenate--cysteine ligase CoaBC [Rhodospirillaceae bacterium]
MVGGRRILLIVSGGIAAYKSLELIRRLREHGAAVTCVLTAAATKFVTPLSVGALADAPPLLDLFDPQQELQIGHIKLARAADLVIVAPATADILARMAHGLADDLATTVLLAATGPILVAPAMNPAMWAHPATQANMAVLRGRGVHVIGPEEGAMAEAEWGVGRMAEPPDILEEASILLARAALPSLAGLSALVTSGPTHEPIDPVRYIANRSSGRQGHAIAAALAEAGAAVTLVAGPTQLADPPGVQTVHVESAREMLAACLAAQPVDIAVCAAAVADWRVAGAADQKLKKDASGPPALVLTENPDILATLAASGPGRPALVVGFAAETVDVVANATAKRRRKGCDWILANDVGPSTGTFGGTDNTIHLVTADGVDTWPRLSKDEVARRLAVAIADRFAGTEPGPLEAGSPTP